jgi:hypothetical protein
MFARLSSKKHCVDGGIFRSKGGIIIRKLPIKIFKDSNSLQEVVSRLPLSSSLHTSCNIVCSFLNSVCRILQTLSDWSSGTASRAFESFPNPSSESTDHSSHCVGDAAKGVADGTGNELCASRGTGVLLTDGHRGGRVRLGGD